MHLLQNIAPIANALQGKLNSTVNLKGNLTESFTPNLATISGDTFAQVLVNSINKDNLKLIGKLEENLNFLDLEKLNLNDLKTRLTIENGFVNVKPFTVNYKLLYLNNKIDGIIANTTNHITNQIKLGRLLST